MTDTYELIIGEFNYSSWSMRAWLFLKHIEVPFKLTPVQMYRDNSRETVRSLGGETGLVPVLKHSSVTVWDTIAILEYLAERHPSLWPKGCSQRALARSYVNEIHSGMVALRDAMPVNTRARNRPTEIGEQVANDIARIEQMWNRASDQSGWMFDEYSAVDMIFAAIATRFQTYGYELSGRARDYQMRLLGHPHMREWLEIGRKEDSWIEQLELS